MTLVPGRYWQGPSREGTKVHKGTVGGPLTVGTHRATVWSTATQEEMSLVRCYRQIPRHEVLSDLCCPVPGLSFYEECSYEDVVHLKFDLDRNPSYPYSVTLGEEGNFIVVDNAGELEGDAFSYEDEMFKVANKIQQKVKFVFVGAQKETFVCGVIRSQNDKKTTYHLVYPHLHVSPADFKKITSDVVESIGDVTSNYFAIDAVASNGVHLRAPFSDKLGASFTDEPYAGRVATPVGWMLPVDSLDSFKTDITSAPPEAYRVPSMDERRTVLFPAFSLRCHGHVESEDVCKALPATPISPSWRMGSVARRLELPGVLSLSEIKAIGGSDLIHKEYRDAQILANKVHAEAGCLASQAEVAKAVAPIFNRRYALVGEELVVRSDKAYMRSMKKSHFFDMYAPFTIEHEGLTAAKKKKGEASSSSLAVLWLKCDTHFIPRYEERVFAPSGDVDPGLFNTFQKMPFANDECLALFLGAVKASKKDDLDRCGVDFSEVEESDSATAGRLEVLTTFIACLFGSEEGREDPAQAFYLDCMAGKIMDPSWRPRDSQRGDYKMLLMGGNEGLGKSLFHSLFGSLFGVHFLSTARKALMTARFNTMLSSRCVVCAEEIIENQSDNSGEIKDQITADSRIIEAKFAGPTEEINHTMWIGCTNNPDAVYCDGAARRFFPVWVRLPPGRTASQHRAWMRSTVCPALYGDKFTTTGEKDDVGRKLFQGLLVHRYMVRSETPDWLVARDTPWISQLKLKTNEGNIIGWLTRAIQDGGFEGVLPHGERWGGGWEGKDLFPHPRHLMKVSELHKCFVHYLSESHAREKSYLGVQAFKSFLGNAKGLPSLGFKVFRCTNFFVKGASKKTIAVVVEMGSLQNVRSILDNYFCARTDFGVVADNACDECPPPAPVPPPVNFSRNRKISNDGFMISDAVEEAFWKGQEMVAATRSLLDSSVNFHKMARDEVKRLQKGGALREEVEKAKKVAARHKKDVADRTEELEQKIIEARAMGRAICDHFPNGPDEMEIERRSLLEAAEASFQTSALWLQEAVKEAGAPSCFLNVARDASRMAVSVAAKKAAQPPAKKRRT